MGTPDPTLERRRSESLIPPASAKHAGGRGEGKHPMFDTLHVTKELRESGIDDAQAEAIVVAFGAIAGSVATRDDLRDFATKDDLRDFATKDDLRDFATKDDLRDFATKDDLRDFATKDDLRDFATKDDLRDFATKDDLRDFATKDDLRDFATKDDLRDFATKDDLRNFATKDDLRDFATKDDLKDFATKDDLRNFATKDDLKLYATEARLNEAIGELRHEMDNGFKELYRHMSGESQKLYRYFWHFGMGIITVNIAMVASIFAIAKYLI